jgi:hypothetical protein
MIAPTITVSAGKEPSKVVPVKRFVELVAAEEIK